MRRHVIGVVGVLILAGCATTVPGSPAADPSGVPRPDTGNYPTTPRTIAPMNDRQQVATEGFRMVEIIPLAPDVDSALRYPAGAFPAMAGRLQTIVGSEFGEGIGTALADHEIGAYTAARDKSAGSDSLASSRQILTGLFRFKDEAAARAAVANPAIMSPDKASGSAAPTPKLAVAVPGHADAKAYSETLGTSTSTAGVLASGRYVLAIWTNSSVELITRYFDLQLKSLRGFVPTPVDRFSTLPRDHDGLLTLTLPEDEGSSIFDRTFTARGIAAVQSDIATSAKDLADAGVDYVANAGTTVYRSRDAAAASVLADRFVSEVKARSPHATESTVRGVPGGRCVNYPASSKSKDLRTYCAVSVGRYLTEVTDSQETRAKQAIGASYVILQGAR